MYIISQTYTSHKEPNKGGAQHGMHRTQARMYLYHGDDPEAMGSGADG
jgi:hypothetical protein